MGRTDASRAKFARILACVTAACFAIPAIPALSIAQPCSSLETLFAYPNIWGTAPSAVKWSPDSRAIAFTWNAQGMRFHDLYRIEAESGQCARLTDLGSSPALPQQEDRRSEEEIALERAYDGGVEQFEWAPDSRTIAFTLHGDIHLIDTHADGSARCLMRTEESESQPRFSPDGGLLAFVRSQNLFTYDLRTGEIRQLTTLESNAPVRSYPSSSPIHAYEWSPDGSRIALMTRDTSDLEDIVIPDYLHDRTEAEEWKRNFTGKPVFRTSVGVVSRAGGLVRWIDWGGEDYFNNSETDYHEAFAWSPDGSALLVNWNDSCYSERRIYLVDPQTLERSEIYRECQKPYFARLDALWSSDGSEIYLTSERDGYRHIYALAVDERAGTADRSHDADPRARAPFGEDAATAALRQLTRGSWDVLAIRTTPHSDNIFFTASLEDPLDCQSYMIDRAGGDPIALTFGLGTHRGEPSPNGARMAVRFSRFLHPPELRLIETGRPSDFRVALSTASPAMNAISEGLPCEPERVVFRNDEDGADIHGFLLKPPSFDPARRYPAVVSGVYANSAKDDWSPYDLLDLYMAAHMGFVVLRLDLRASDGYGRDFRYGCYQRMGLVDAGECVSAAGYLRSLPYVDDQRLGLWGSSYGGFLTLMTLFLHPGVFQAGVAWKPVSDWRNYTDDYTAQRLGRPEEFPEVYDATSPIHHVKGLADPLLVIHGMLDDNVLFQDTVLLVQKLLEAGKTFDVMFYPKSDHSLTYWQENRRDLMTRTARFFGRHLGEDPRP
ncbi:MAG: S9 family peptidase [Candidatus Eisenbacteria bacterium]|nr:S9 family peptidase [Candidatus Eisenbacteria bacterium]